MRPSTYLDKKKLPMKTKLKIAYKVIDFVCGSSLAELKWAISCNKKQMKYLIKQKSIAKRQKNQSRRVLK
jgi:hypothetical protein